MDKCNCQQQQGRNLVNLSNDPEMSQTTRGVHDESGLLLNNCQQCIVFSMSRQYRTNDLVVVQHYLTM